MIGGLGSAVADVIAESGKGCAFAKIGLPDCYCEVGYPEDLYSHYGIDADGIVDRVRALLGTGVRGRRGLGGRGLMATESAATTAAGALAAAARPREFLRARLFLRAALPGVKVMLEDDPATKKRFEGVRAVVQFVAKNEPRAVGAYLVFDDGGGRVGRSGGRRTVGGLPRGAGVLRAARYHLHLRLAAEAQRLLRRQDGAAGHQGAPQPGAARQGRPAPAGLKLMLPSAQPKDPAKRRLKVKLTLYMITTALSQYNKGGDPEMKSWTAEAARPHLPDAGGA